jgi:hypothetical protein
MGLIIKGIYIAISVIFIFLALVVCPIESQAPVAQIADCSQLSSSGSKTSKRFDYLHEIACVNHLTSMPI